MLDHVPSAFILEVHRCNILILHQMQLPQVQQPIQEQIQRFLDLPSWCFLLQDK